MTHIPSRLQPALELVLPAGLRPAESAVRPDVEAEVLSLFDAWAAGLRRYIASFGLGTEATDDILQDVFLSLFRHLSLGRPRTNLKAWLFQVAHNLALKQRRRRFRRQRTETGWDAVQAERLVDPQPTPEERLANDERRRRLVAIVSVMPERDRQCLLLRAEGLAYRDIARTLGVSLGTVAKSLTRAVARLTDVDRR
jgi:RNA polymerase sigma-70 factor (ECF subfamily)